MLDALRFIEPLSFGGTSLNALIEKGKREVTKEKLGQLYTFCTGLEGHYEIIGDEREIDIMNQNAKEKSDFRGNRGQSLPLAKVARSWEHAPSTPKINIYKNKNKCKYKKQLKTSF